MPSAPEDLDDGLRFLLAQLREHGRRSDDLEATLAAVVGALVDGGVIAGDDLERRRLQAHALVEREPAARLGEARDKYRMPALDLDCAPLLPLCRARCCQMIVYLSEADLDERVLDWDHAHPYQLPVRDGGYCRYCAPGTLRCADYQHRPATCRGFDCRQDPRIWKDFAGRIPADP